MSNPRQLTQKATQLFVAGRGDKAIGLFKQARDLYLDSNNIYCAAECQYMVGVALVSEGQQKEGLKNLNTALQTQETLKMPTAAATTLRELGSAHMLYGRYFESQSLFSDSLELFLEIDSLQEKLLCWAKLARLYSLTGEASQALLYLELSRPTPNSFISDQHLIAIHTNRLFALIELDMLDQAPQILTAARQILAQSGLASTNQRRAVQLMGLELNILRMTKSWLAGWRLYNLQFVDAHEDLSEGCRAVLNLEIDTSSIIRHFASR